jgi:hypothetical protein
MSQDINMPVIGKGIKVGDSLARKEMIKQMWI